MEEDPGTLIALIVAALVVVALAFFAARRSAKKRSLALRDHFGPEYDHLVAEHGDKERAERELIARKKRRQQLDIRLLSREQCERFSSAWATVQQRFVDDPSGAVFEADGLVKDVMKARGYPVGDFEQRVADLSVEHANVIDHYRAARTLAQANASGDASTEDLRQAMVHYRALFNDLLQAEQQYAAPMREARA